MGENPIVSTLNAKIALLKEAYRTFDQFIGAFTVACKRYCCLCCTGNATATTLEGYLIVDHLIRTNRLDLLEGLHTASSTTRFQPKMSTNMLADLCAQGKDIPDEESDAEWSSCLFVVGRECPIYPVRPFGCRCMVSKKDCHIIGFADMDPFVLSVNSLFLQTIEHIDPGGYFGNLVDILLLIKSKSHRDTYRSGLLKVSPGKLIPNRPARILFIPPEHRERIRPILSSLRRIRAPMGEGNVQTPALGA
jgi:hypothetical protein